MKQNFNFDNIVKNFKFTGKFINAEPYGFGHINDTFAAYFEKADGKSHRYILQRINSDIFKSPENLMENILRITHHLYKKIKAADGNPERETLNIIPATDGNSFYKSNRGDYWRGYIFIEGAKTYQIVQDYNHFYNGGKAFGRFQKRLSDFPANELYETIPDFHHTPKRFNAFIKALDDDKLNRAQKAIDEINFVTAREKDAKILQNLLEKGSLPLRVTHNDTKFNNVMIDDITGEGICVIDLDTVMPGLSLFDFGDSIRSGANPAAEDEKNLSKVCMDLKLYEYFTKGFLESAGGFLTAKELEYLPFSARIMTFECGMRFLTDFLNGDVYFKTHREGHNLDRARTQFKMTADMENKYDKMIKIVRQYS